MGLFGIQTSSGVVDFRAPDDVWAALRLFELSRSGHIAEIVGGFVGVALHCFRQGLWTTVFDLPIVGVLQGFFLAKAIGGDNVKLYGEDIADRAVNVLPWWLFMDRGRRFDVVFNRDSMAEFPQAAARAYLREIRARHAMYLSINQEAEAESGQTGIIQLSVSKFAVAEGLRRASRSRYCSTQWIERQASLAFAGLRRYRPSGTPHTRSPSARWRRASRLHEARPGHA